MKTALEELIDWIDENQIEIILNTSIVRTKATELLVKERDQIEAAYKQGWDDKVYTRVDHVEIGGKESENI